MPLCFTTGVAAASPALRAGTLREGLHRQDGCDLTGLGEHLHKAMTQPMAEPLRRWPCLPSVASARQGCPPTLSAAHIP